MQRFLRVELKKNVKNTLWGLDFHDISMDISIIIVSYNVRHYLRQCLESVFASIRQAGLETEVFVVDNNSTDNSVGYIRSTFPTEKFPSLHIIANRCNVGFGRANNQALRKASGRYVLYLNPDTIITEHTLRDCYDFAEGQEKVGAIGARMLNATGTFALESRRGLPTPWVAFCKMSGLGNLFPKSKVFGKYYMRYLDEMQPAQIEIVSGAFMFCNREALNECGAFDEQFFMYGEDIDLSYRFLKGGFHNWYNPTPILHYKGESTHKGSYKYVHTFYEAMLIFFQKHFPTASFALSIPVKTAILVQACMALVKQQFQAFMQYLRPSKDNNIMTLSLHGHDEIPAELEELAVTWGLDITDHDPDILAFDAKEHTFASILQTLETEHRQIGMYYEDLHMLILPGGIYS